MQKMAKTSLKRRTRKPDVTREKLLQAAFEEIHRRGFQAASLETILARAGVTKGALYHHFPDKSSLGQAVVAEVVRDFLLARWSIDQLSAIETDPVTALQRILEQRSTRLSRREVELGCPLNNLAQEMSPLDERFRRQVNRTFESWRAAFGKALARGQAEGTVRADIDPQKTSAFIVAAIEGSFGLAKSAQSPALLRSNLAVLGSFLESLRPVPKGKRTSRRAARQ